MKPFDPIRVVAKLESEIEKDLAAYERASTIANKQAERMLKISKRVDIIREWIEKIKSEHSEHFAPGK